MKNKGAIFLSIFSIAASASIFMSSCGSQTSTVDPDIDTATVRPSLPASAEITTTTTAAVTETADTTSAAATVSETKGVTSADGTSSVPDSSDVSSSVNPEDIKLSDETMNELVKQQRQQLMAVSTGYKSAYITFIRSKLIFKAMLGSEGKKMSAQEVHDRISEMEESYYNANFLVFADKKEDIAVKDLRLTQAEDDLQPDSAAAYRMTFTAEADGEKVPMQGFVIVLGKTVMSVSEPSEGIVP